MNIKQKLINFAVKNDIHDIGFCSAEPFYEIEDILIKRKEKNYLSGFEEKDIKKRIDPKLTMEDVKSIIVIGQSYYINEDKIPKDANEEILRGKMSMIALGLDYHKKVKEKLVLIGEYLKTLVECEYQTFVDTGPLVDREIAKRAGLGFQGKNNCLISKKLGSFFNIGYLLVNTSMKLDNYILENKCGNCNICKNVCPTNAIQNDFEVNAKKCVSYLTQTKEEIPENLKNKIKNNLYGCDLCQKYCPYNKNLISLNNEKITYDDIFPSLHKIIDMSNKEYKDTFGNSSCGWIGKTRLQRNAIISLGNSSSPKAIKILKLCLNKENEMLKEYAMWAICNLERTNFKKKL